MVRFAPIQRSLPLLCKTHPYAVPDILHIRTETKQADIPEHTTNTKQPPRRQRDHPTQPVNRNSAPARDYLSKLWEIHSWCSTLPSMFPDGTTRNPH